MLNKTDILVYLRTLGLSNDEAKLYIELLKGPTSHLELARKTGVNRTKVYRLANQLEKRSLVSLQTDDSGTLLAATDPASLEVELVTQEENLKQQRAVLKQLMPALTAIKASHGKGPESFSVQTYEGVEGFKQMLWHELKASGEVLVMGSGSLESLVPSKRWAETHRAKSVAAGYTIRELLNPGTKKDDFTNNPDFMANYVKRHIDSETLLLEHQIVIYNDTVATYCWRGDQKVGSEIVNKANAQMMRQVFEQYWLIAI